MHKRLLSFGLMLVMTLTCFSVPMSVFAETGEKAEKLTVDTSVQKDDGSYYYYHQKYEKEANYEGFLDIDATKFQKVEKNVVKTYKDEEGVEKKGLVFDENEKNTWAEYTLDVKESKLYGLTLEYLQLPCKNKDIEMTVFIDGKVPYSEAMQMVIPRLWRDNINPKNVPEGLYFECADKNGNADDARPVQKEHTIWTTRDLINVRGLYTEPYQFYLTAGKHTIRIRLDREAIALSKISFGNTVQPKKYSEYISKFTDNDEVKNGKVKFGEEGDLSIVKQAEQTAYKNNVILYPTYDKSNANTFPADPAYTKLNTIGSTSWKTNGDELTWKVEAKEAGLYKMVFRAKQNFNSGMYSYRTLKINGEVPFEEAANIGFKYKQGWQMVTVGNKETDQDMYVYLNKGVNTVSLVCTTGVMSAVLREVQQSVLTMNEIYREIIAVTSTEPDIYRDYSLEQQIPTLVNDLKSAYKALDDTSKLAQQITGTAGSEASALDYVAHIVRDFYEDPYVITQRLASFKDSIETLGNLVATLGELSVEIDYFAFLPTDVETPKANKGFFKSAKFAWDQFISSFIVDYNMTADVKQDTTGTDVVKVWVSTGRDQSKIINRLINDTDKLVTSKGKKISIELSLVDTGNTLIRATLAGKGPDCALMIGEDTPMNLAARGALLPLTDYKDDVADQFQKDAFTPFWYDGNYYAIPETEVFDLMFYRIDVFKEYGLSVPKTWKEYYHVMEILQNANLKVGMLEVNSINAGVSAGVGVFSRFLVQNGGTFYSKELDRTRFDEEVAYNAFEEWVNLYSKYGLDRQFDFYSRFRTGEMPIGISSYVSYNQIKAAAPELNGLWTFAPVPGIEREDGSINNLETADVTGSIMLKSAKKKGVEEAASVFLKWWASAETQASYANELEATLGVAGRYHSANKVAFEKLAWTKEEANVIKSQWDHTIILNQIPGNYLLMRSITSAFRKAVVGTDSARRALTLYNKDINDEITRKRKEFGLE